MLKRRIKRVIDDIVEICYDIMLIDLGKCCILNLLDCFFILYLLL